MLGMMSLLAGTPDPSGLSQRLRSEDRHSSYFETMATAVWVRRQVRHRRGWWLVGLAGVHGLLIAAVLVLKLCGSNLKVFTTARGPEHARVRRQSGSEPARHNVLSAAEEDSGNCTPRAVNNFPPDFLTVDQTKEGGVVLHILIACYLFAALAIICDDYFVPSLERICEDLHLQEDVAGATFMAAGSSAPELCTSVVGVFIARSDVGVGTIVGSAVFNILFIIGLCGVFAGMVVQLTWYPLVRDTLFYLVSVVALVLCIQDSQVHWYEALLMLGMYCLYIVIMYFNPRLERACLNTWARLRSGVSHTDDKHQDVEDRQPLLAESSASHASDKHGDVRGSRPLLTESGASHSGEAEGSHARLSGPGAGSVRRSADDTDTGRVQKAAQKDEKETSLVEGPKPNSQDEKDNSSDDDASSPWDIPENFLLRVLWVAMVPMKCLYFLTVPDCQQPRMRRLYPLTFVMSVIWIAGSTYVLVWMITIAGDALEIPDTVMGLTLLAAGTSIPDCLSSLLVARDGFGDMAVSNSIGSNVFDILICLGVPWLIETAVVNRGDHVTINSSGLLYSSLTLLATVVFLLVSISVNRWRLTPSYGGVCLAAYALVITLSSLYELNIFADLNPPSCPR